MQQKETERADDRIDEEFYEELSEEEIQDEIASLYRRRGYMDAETLCRIDREIRIAEQVLRRRLGRRNKKRMKSLFIKNFYIPLQGIIFLF